MPIINFIAASNILSLINAKFYFADVDKITGQMTPKTLDDCIKKNRIKKIKAFVTMYLGGSPDNVYEFFKIKKKYNCYMIEDACHALGAFYNHNNKKIGVGSCKHSDICTFSLHPLKSITSGYASFDYEFKDYQESDLVKVQILVNSEPVDALSFICHRSKSATRGKVYCEKLKDLIPRQQFKIPLQASIGGKIIARETINSYRKDVTAKLYGGDVTRKNKLLDKQKKGKKRMRQFGKVEIPQSAFINVLKTSLD